MVVRPLALCLMMASGTTSSGQNPGQPALNPFGEAERTSTSHLTVEASISRTTVAPGERLTVRLDVTPRPTMHVYAPGKHDYQVVELVVDSQPWLRAGPTAYAPSQKYYFAPLDETVEVYSKRFRVTRAVTILDTPGARKSLEGKTAVTLTGTLQYQACDDKVCYAPAKVPVRFTVTLKRDG